MCEDRGGLASVSETPTVKDTPECDAYCAKIASLGCDDRECNRAFWCAVDEGQCAEQKRAYLQCVVDTGTWQCTEQGWGASSSCSTQNVSCPGETDSDS